MPGAAGEANIPRKPDKVEAIVQAAFKAIADKGYARVSMRDIALEAGVSKSVLHYYFQNKDELVSAVFHSLDEKFKEIAIEAVSVPLDVEGRLSKAFDEFLELTEHEPEWFIVMMDLVIQGVRSPEKREEVYSMNENLKGIVADGFREARETGVIRADVDDNVLASLVIGIVNGLALQYVTGMRAEDFKRAFSDFRSMLNAFLQPPA
jgi:TetR/AcrR family transcriptional regulator, fatty acid metabolism regulator protein